MNDKTDDIRVFGEELLPHELVSDSTDAQNLDDAPAFDEFVELFGHAAVSEEFKQEAIPKWRAARSIKKLLAQVNEAYPERSKASDGIIGDVRHCPNGKGKSDHCPNIPLNGTGVVTALDITHDPKNGCDVDAITSSIRESKDRRIKYMIRNGKICSSYVHKGTTAWAWRPYSGAPHDKHVHISVSSDPMLFDNENSWSISEIVQA